LDKKKFNKVAKMSLYLLEIIVPFTSAWSSWLIGYALNLLDRIPPKYWPGYASTFPWGKFGAAAIQYPEIQKLSGSRSFL
jgi:hypothetical protein